MPRYTEPSLHHLCGTKHWSLGERATECPPEAERWTFEVSNGPLTAEAKERAWLKGLKATKDD